MKKTNMIKVNESFFTRDVLEVAPELPGKHIVICRNDCLESYCITEVEAYKGEADKACHASKGRTERTEIMYHEGGHIYVYLIYGMYWMLNIVTGEKDDPQAVLIRGIEGYSGPGRVGRQLGINNSYYGIKISNSKDMWIEEGGPVYQINTGPRIGIHYAGEPWISKPWRFYINK